MPIERTIEEAAEVIRSGGIVAYPTEAVWGLGCDPFNQHAVLKLLALKQRPMAKGLILIAANVEQIESYLQLLRPQERQQVLDSWSSPTTWVVPVSLDFPEWIRGEHLSVAIRVSAHPHVQALCSAFGGAIISTSANITGQPSALTAEQIVSIFGDGIDYILPTALGGQKNPSQIRDARTGAVLRPS